MIAFGLNVILGVLLICGLMMGLRLDKRLRGLRENHEGFAKAVQELDQAALRTEASLATLRAGTEAARTELAARIDQARLLTQRLDKLMADADKVLTQPAAHRQHAAAQALDSLRRPAADPALRPAAARLDALADRRLKPRPELRPEPGAEARPQPAPVPAIDPRSRVKVDDDLFEVGGGIDRPRAALTGGRR
jgi:septal ring factor EnvC (AmiA/AmiB activator)